MNNGLELIVLTDYESDAIPIVSLLERINEKGEYTFTTPQHIEQCWSILRSIVPTFIYMYIIYL